MPRGPIADLRKLALEVLEFLDVLALALPADGPRVIDPNAGCARNPGSPSASIKTKVIAKLVANLIASQKFR